MATNGGVMVEHSPRHPRVEGSSPTAAAVTENKAEEQKKVLWYWFLISGSFFESATGKSNFGTKDASLKGKAQYF
jgi:hypothetical protein